MIPKWLLIPFLVTVVLWFASGLQAKEQKAKDKTKVKEIKFDDLRILTEEGSEGWDYSLKFMKDDSILLSEECAFEVNKPGTVEGFPRPDCRSAFFYCFSGGAHCCMSLTLATHCGPLHFLDLIDLAHSDARVRFVDADQNGTQEIKIVDWQFAYYGPEGSDNQLAFADSPPLTRLLVFGKDGWRVDHIGEFENFYTGLYKASQREIRTHNRKKGENERSAGLAIRTAYYCLMSGKSPGEAREVLDRFLPQSWKQESGKILDDIKRAAADFNPAESIE